MNRILEQVRCDFNIFQFASQYKNFYGEDWCKLRNIKINDNYNLRVIGDTYKDFFGIEKGILYINILYNCKECIYNVYIDLSEPKIDIIRHHITKDYYKVDYESVKSTLNNLIKLYVPPKKSKYGVWGQLKKSL